MGATVWGIPWESGQLSNTSVYQPIKMNKDLILIGIRTWVIVYDDPAFTSLNMKIYSDDASNPDHAPKKLLYTSTNNLTKAEIITENNGYKEIYFDFNRANLQASTWYNVVINGVGYAPTGDKHLAWRQAFPDPVYATGLTPSIERLAYSPFALYAIGADA